MGPYVPWSFGDQEKLVTLINKLPEETWRLMREHPSRKKTGATYDHLKDGVRGLVSELLGNEELSRLRVPALMMCEREEALLELAGPVGNYHGRPDRSARVAFKAAVGCHFCCKVGH